MTVSPCEFPPRVLITCVLSAISRNYNSFFSVLVLSSLIKSPYKTCIFISRTVKNFLIKAVSL